MARGTTLFNFGKYAFASWARRGVGNTIKPNGNSLVRAEIPLSVKLNNEELPQTIELLGPADVDSILRNAIVRTEPLKGNYNFEWSMLPYIEFYDEDFAWRYTPDAPDSTGNTLRPWLALVVLKATEFVELPVRRGALPAIRLQSTALPLATELHLWAHMHTGEHAGVTTSELNNILIEIGKNYPKDPDGVTCRLLSPRRLEKKTMYHAFLVPSFETGRLAGLGEKFAHIQARQAAWPDTDRPATLDFPFYYRWSFATTEVSFEDLVSKMKSVRGDQNVGVRNMDTSRAGYIKADGLSGAGVGPTNPPIIKLEGALRTLETKSTLYTADGIGGPGDGFQKDVAALLNLYDKSTATEFTRYSDANMNTDPVLTIPLYGQPYATSITNPPKALVRDGKNWYSAINFDPRNRVAAGLGTQIIQQEQETLMQSAWYQLQVLKEARNNFAAIGSIMERMSSRLVNTALIPSEDFVAMARNLTGRVTATATATTVLQQIRSSATPKALINSASRRTMRPNGNLVTRLKEKGAVNPATTATWNLKTVNSQLTSNTLTLYRFKLRTDVILVDAINEIFIGPLTPFDKAYANYAVRVSRTTQIPLQKPFLFDAAQLVILQAIRNAPARLLQTRLNTTAFTVSVFGTTTASVPVKRPPAEFVGQPVFLNPMYAHLWKLDKEWFLPNISLIANNTITLLETNTHFINSYMLGLNHEMGREMLWREFPADLSATFFRNFWQANDESPTLQSSGLEPIKNWLGATAPERISKGSAAKLVLTIRGELLHKFPNTIILAAHLQRDPVTGNLLPPGEEDFKFPLFFADLPPDLKFIGFDLTASEVLAGTSVQPSRAKEWYFILMEPVGEPRFGLDAAFRSNDAAKYNRNDLAWDHLMNPGLPDFLTAANKPSLLNMPLAAPDKELWGKNAASMAALLFQQPFSLVIKATDFINPKMITNA